LPCFHPNFLITAISKCPLPEYKEKEEKTDAEQCNKTDKKEKNILKHPYILLFLSFLFFTISSGTEGFFISQSYTFGICGPHKMMPAKVLFKENTQMLLIYFRLHL
jgi:hypothetical protein